MSNFERDFDKLMETVEVLRGHFDFVDRKAERLMVKFRRARDRQRFDQVLAFRKAMRQDYQRALDLIADQITTPEQLRRTRKEVSDIKDVAWKFVKRLRAVEATLNDIEAAAKVMREFVVTLGRIL